VVGGTGADSLIVSAGSLLKYPSGYSPGGRRLLFEQIGERTGWDVWEVSTSGDHTPRPLLTSTFDEQNASWSPDGRWLVFTSNESGRAEAYVQDYPGAASRHQVSTAGGFFPRWRADGRELAYATANGIELVEVSPEAGFHVGTAHSHPLRGEVVYGDLTPDFSRVLAVVRTGSAAQNSDLTMVLNWRSELARK
jgi:Tol biopolymer transport system component